MKNVFISISMLLVLMSFNLQTYAKVIIPLYSESGIYKVPCKINGLKLNLVFDTGASFITISNEIAEIMTKNGSLTAADIIGTGKSQVANGKIVDHTEINLKKVEIGSYILYNIRAIVIQGETVPLLLGQSAIKKLGKFSISNGQLIINPIHSNSNKQNILSGKELDLLYNKSLTFYEHCDYKSAAANFEILYMYNYLSPVDIMKYAITLGKIKQHAKSLSLLSEIENWYNDNDPYELPALYAKICVQAYYLRDFEILKKYVNLIKVNANVITSYYKESIMFLAVAYDKKGDKYNAKKEIRSYLNQYMYYMDVKTEDCWDKAYKDSNIADMFYNLWLVSQHELADLKFIILSAAWGNLDAQKICNENNCSFKTNPENYDF